MAFTVVYDACVLYPSTLRDLLIRIAAAGLVQAKWSERILNEVFENLARNRPDLRQEKLDRTRELMKRAVRDCLVVGHEPLESVFELPDPDDRHVLAAAVKARAQLIVTRNTKDFPSEATAPWDVEAVHPDDFVLAQLDLDRGRIFACVQQIADSWQNPPGVPADVLDRLERDGLVKATAALRAGY
ncbi:PIN domain-containing protein [Streptomyces echinoruber]|uniref:PIN domain-containing protein n=1 Tax=Streptomyces echinoruber TaxID=68898 RepID=A0A918VE32_9ACTN|nr:PIN domain-containing protein [Streptomyces echinoruber]GGZ90748.1 PIN domain-containing protein [Streptomyces echinoruber]